MALEMKQSQRMTQELRMTPQLQQAIKLLQLSRLELAEVIQTEMVENPMLEESIDDGPVPGERNDELSTEHVSPAKSQEGEEAKKAVDDIDWEAYLENYSSPMPGSAAVRGDDDLPSYEQTLATTTSLTDHLLWQLGATETDDEERQLAEVIIGNLDEDGYLRISSLEEFAEREETTVDAIEDALTLVQEFDPAGVAARDLRECLLLQAEREAPRDIVLRKVIKDHINSLETKDYSGIARALGVSKDEVMDAHRAIITFNPKPGRIFSDQQPTYIVPDIYIVRQNDEWVATLNEDGLPRLKVSDYYRRALKNNAGSEAKSYVQERLRSAWWLIRSIQQRQRTIVKVTESIIRFQRDFFDHGIEHLKPLVLREVADEIGMHESTISRVTTNKYVHTPRGIFELKFFFNSSIKKSGGDDVAAEAVKHLLKQVIATENQAKPYSDQKLVEILKSAHKIHIARRTVAKYREALGILSSSKRKRLL